MEDKREEIKKYLQNVVNPILKPMVEEITKERPKDIMQFILAYAQRHAQAQIPRADTHDHSEDEMTKEQEDEINRKLQERQQKKVGAKKHSRKGISAEVFGDFNKKGEFTAKVIKKSEESISFLKNLLLKSIMFQNLSEENLKIVIDAMEELKFTPEMEVIKEGDAGDMLYVIGSGEYECTKVINAKKTYLKTYKTGELFGELSLMYNAKRAASIKCAKAGTLYALDRMTFINIVQESAIKKRKDYEKIIDQIEILSDVKEYEKQQLCDTLKEEKFEAGEYVVKEGDDGDRLYFVVEGNLVAEKTNLKTAKKEVVFKYKEREYFGEIALVKNTVRQASIKTVTRCKLLSISRDEFKRLLGPIEDILQRNMEKYKKYMNQ